LDKKVLAPDMIINDTGQQDNSYILFCSSVLFVSQQP